MAPSSAARAHAAGTSATFTNGIAQVRPPPGANMPPWMGAPSPQSTIV